MDNHRNKDAIFTLAIQSQACHIKDITVFLSAILLFLIIQFFFSGFGAYLRKQDEWMNICEMYILVAGSRWTQNAWFPCLLLWWSGKGIQGRGSETKLIRSTRGIWYWANVWMICVDSLFFCVLTIISSLSVCSGNWKCTSEWSAFLLRQTGAMQVPWLSSVDINTGMLQTSTPWKMAFATLILQNLLVMLVGLILYLFRLMKRVVSGYLVACSIWIYDLLIRQEYLRKWTSYLSPLSWGRSGTLNWGYNNGSPTFTYVITVMLTMISILILAGRIIMRYCDLAEYASREM